MKRIESHIQNLGFVISSTDSNGKSTSGVNVSHSVVNGATAKVTVQTVKGARKGASTELNLEAVTELHEALGEILAVNSEDN